MAARTGPAPSSGWLDGPPALGCPLRAPCETVTGTACGMAATGRVAPCIPGLCCHPRRGLTRTGDVAWGGPRPRASGDVEARRSRGSRERPPHLRSSFQRAGRGAACHPAPTPTAPARQPRDAGPKPRPPHTTRPPRKAPPHVPPPFPSQDALRGPGRKSASSRACVGVCVSYRRAARDDRGGFPSVGVTPVTTITHGAASRARETRPFAGH